MNGKNHFFTSFNVLALLFIKNASMVEIIIFSLVFGVLIDANEIIGKKLKKPLYHRRTLVEEPAGLLLIGLPLGFLLSLVKREYLFMTLIPYAVHIILDYLTLHEVSPFTPFLRKNIKVGIFKAQPDAPWYKGNERGVPENYFLLLNIAVTISIFINLLL